MTSASTWRSRAASRTAGASRTTSRSRPEQRSGLAERLAIRCFSRRSTRDGLFPTARLHASSSRSRSSAPSRSGSWECWRSPPPAREAGAIAAALAAAYPSLVWICAYALSEALYSLLALATALVLQRAVDGNRLGLASFAGALAGIAALVRPAMLLFLPLAIAWMLFRRRPTLAIALGITAAVVVAPWTVRNLRVHDRFVLIASEGGVTFWTGNHPLAIGEGDLAANIELKRAELAFRAAHPGLTAEQLEPLYYREAFSWIAAHPGRWIVLLARKAFYTVVPVGPSYAVHSARYRIASILPYVIAAAVRAGGGTEALPEPATPCRVVPAGRFGDPYVHGVLSAGEVSNSRDRSRAHRLRRGAGRAPGAAPEQAGRSLS